MRPTPTQILEKTVQICIEIDPWLLGKREHPPTKIDPKMPPTEQDYPHLMAGAGVGKRRTACRDVTLVPGNRTPKQTRSLLMETRPGTSAHAQKLAVMATTAVMYGHGWWG